LKIRSLSGHLVVGPAHRHSGYTMMASGRILTMGLGGAAGNSPIPFEATINVVVNGKEKEDYSVTIPRGRYSAARRFSTPLELFPDDKINFRSASGNPNVTTANPARYVTVLIILLYK